MVLFVWLSKKLGFSKISYIRLVVFLNYLTSKLKTRWRQLLKDGICRLIGENTVSFFTLVFKEKGKINSIIYFLLHHIMYRRNILQSLEQ